MTDQPIIEIRPSRPVVEVAPPRPTVVDIVTDTVQGVKGDKGDPGVAGGAVYEMELVIPTTSVTVPHNFGYRPSVRFTREPDGMESQVAVDHVDENTTVVSSVLPMTGHLTLS